MDVSWWQRQERYMFITISLVSLLWDISDRRSWTVIWMDGLVVHWASEVNGGREQYALMRSLSCGLMARERGWEETVYGSGGGEKVLLEHTAWHGKGCTRMGDFISIAGVVDGEWLELLVFCGSAFWRMLLVMGGNGLSIDMVSTVGIGHLSCDINWVYIGVNNWFLLLIEFFMQGVFVAAIWGLGAALAIVHAGVKGISVEQSIQHKRVLMVRIVSKRCLCLVAKRWGHVEDWMRSWSWPDRVLLESSNWSQMFSSRCKHWSVAPICSSGEPRRWLKCCICSIGGGWSRSCGSHHQICSSHDGVVMAGGCFRGSLMRRSIPTDSAALNNWGRICGIPLPFGGAVG